MSYIILNILKTSAYISLPILLIVLLKDKFLNQYTSKLNYILSILITIRMLFILNITIDLPSSFFTSQVNLTNTTTKNIYYLNVESTSSYNYLNIIFIVWIIGFTYTILKNISNHFIFINKMQSITYKINDLNVIECLENEKRNLHIKSNINVFKVDGLSSPTLINAFNSKILIPNKDYNTKELHWIFKHELTHFKRKDNLLKLILMIASSIHWFNPLVKILNVYFYEQCELSCDEQVIKNINTEDAKGYALVLLNTLRYRNNLKATMLHSQFNNDQINLIKRRIEGIMNLKKCKKGIFLAVSVCAISAFSVISFNINNETNSAYADELESSKTAPESKQVTEDEIRKNFEHADESEMKDLMEFYEDRKFEDLTQEEIDYALDFLFTGKCKKVNIGSDAIYSINHDNLKHHTNHE